MLASAEYDNHKGGRLDPEPEPEPSQNESTTTTPRVLTIIASVIDKLVARNDRLADRSSQQLANGNGFVVRVGTSLNTFYGARSPNISIAKYMERIYKYTNCSPSCFVVGYVYIDRLLHRHPDSLVVSLNVHRLLVTSIMVASKMMDDVHYNNAFYARVGGVSNAELNRLELELLFLLDFGVTVSSRTFESYCLHLEREMTVSNGTAQKIERAFIPNSLDDVTEISMENTESCSPPSSSGLVT